MKSVIVCVFGWHTPCFRQMNENMWACWTYHNVECPSCLNVLFTSSTNDKFEYMKCAVRYKKDLKKTKEYFGFSYE